MHSVFCLLSSVFCLLSSVYPTTMAAILFSQSLVLSQSRTTRCLSLRGKVVSTTVLQLRFKLELISNVDIDELMDTVEIDRLHFFFLDLFYLPVRSMTILVRFFTPSARSLMEGHLLLCCGVPAVMSVCVHNIRIETLPLMSRHINPPQFCLIPLGLNPI